MEVDTAAAVNHSNKVATAVTPAVATAKTVTRMEAAEVTIKETAIDPINSKYTPLYAPVN